MGYEKRETRQGTICTKKLSAEEVAFAAAAQVPEVAAPAPNAAVDELEALLAGMGMGQQAVAEWGGEDAGGMNMDGGARRRRHSGKGASRRKAHRKSHRKSHRKAHRRSANRKTRRHA